MERRVYGIIRAVKNNSRIFPFRVDRNDATGLVEQVVDKFRQAIRGGFYRAGDTLPTIRALAPELGVSVRVTAEAIKRLAKEGYVAPRPRIGSVVLAKNMPLWKGHIVVVLPEGEYGYYQNHLIGRIRSVLFREGYLCTQVTVPLVGRKKYDTSVLDIVLSRPINFVVALFNCKVVLRMLAKASVPYLTVAVDCRGKRNCVGSILGYFGPALEAFARKCAADGIRRVLHIGKASDEAGAAPYLEAEGINVRRRWISEDLNYGRLEGIQRSAIELFRALSADGSLRWPDLIYCTDDYLANAALMSLEHLHIRVPQDVRFATVSNKGHGPVAWGPISRIEFDAVASGDAVARGALACLQGRDIPPDLTISPIYIPEDEQSS